MQGRARCRCSTEYCDIASNLPHRPAMPAAL
ncbi:Uncharacterised protein [Vibrio cholerae]|nr:Uncharacterised protein [Vibrio cholerae]